MSFHLKGNPTVPWLDSFLKGRAYTHFYADKNYKSTLSRPQILNSVMLICHHPWEGFGVLQ